MTPPSLAPSVHPPETSADLDNLQGDWLTIEGRRAGELCITGHTYWLRFLDGTFYKGTFELRIDRSPSVMIMHVEEGPPKHQGKTAWCLYALDIGQLHWCPTEPGSDEHLDAFPELDDRRYLNTVFRRDSLDLD